MGTQEQKEQSIKPYQECGYVTKANEYIGNVLSGTIPVCDFIRQACQRQKDDLAKKTFAYRFDLKKAENPCFFIEQLPHIEGPLAGKLIHLEPWQCFLLTTLFGWVNKDTGARRFRRAYVEMPKGNGKSALSSGVMLYMTLADNEGGAQVFSAATTTTQARIVFGIAQKMLKQSPKLRTKFKATVGAHDITVGSTSSLARSVSSEADSVEGINPHCVIVDELHAHQTRALWDNIETALGKRKQDLLFAITTAGANISGICFEVRSYLVDILAGKKKDDSVFGVIYTIDTKDDWATEKALIKANPNWGISFSAGDRLQKLNKALQLSSSQSAFKTKHLCCWITSASAWMDMRKWNTCADRDLKIDDFKYKPATDTEPAHEANDCVIGMDLASRKDLASIVTLFWRDIAVDTEMERHYYVFGKHFLPQDVIEQSDNSQYLGWVEEGRIITTPGEVNNYRLFTDELKSACSLYNVLEIAHDPYLADMVIGDMVESGVPTLFVKVNQNVANASPALKELEALVLSGRIHHDGDPVLSWAISNVEVKPDHNDNIYPRKAKNQEKNKIDPAVALWMAINRASAQVPNTGFEIVGWA